MANVNTCLFCGEIIPEGMQICFSCARHGPTCNCRKHNHVFTILKQKVRIL